MALFKEVLGFSPKYGKDCFFADTAVVVGNVSMGNNCSVWFNSVIRGDVHFIKIGDTVNIQDNAVIHCTYKKYPTVIGSNVSIGHNAIVHGCTIHNNVLVGMGSIIMDNVVVESFSIVAAGAVVTKGSHIKEGEIWAGIPAKKVGMVSQELKQGEIERIANNYVLYASWY